MPGLSTDFLVLGSGITGLSFAIKASEMGQVTIVTKAEPSDSATSYAQGGIAAALSELDDPQKHFQDTLDAGAGLCDPKAVDVLVHEAVSRVQELIKMGMEFSRDSEGNLDLGKEGGHGENRVVHANDFTGREIENFLLDQVKSNSKITILKDHMAIDLITEHHTGSKPKNCYGAYVLNEANNEIYQITASFTCLCTGGAGHIYPFTTNPTVSTGDGVAMAYRAGCRIRNMEFYQFHPTALFADVKPAFLITEAMRGFGAKLRLANGKEFMHKYDSQAELAPRDIVARAIDSELKISGESNVYLDITHLPAKKVKSHFPNIYETLKKKFKLDLTKDQIPVVPAAHYMCGGILVDLNGKTDLDGLYAMGEVSSTGVHGGNRLASNSLAECLVFSNRAILDIQARFQIESKNRIDKFAQVPSWKSNNTASLEEIVLLRHDRFELQKIMWDYVGIVRSTARLARALRRIDIIYAEIIDLFNRTIPNREILELRNLSLVSQLIVRSALNRHESRGLHFSIDFAENRDASRVDTILTPQVARL